MTELRATIVAHPWAALGCAFVVGGYLAVSPRSPLARAIRAALGSVALTGVRDIVTRQVSTSTVSWFDRSAHPTATS